MRTTKLIAAALCTAAATVAIPAAADASVAQELKASGSVERVATRYYPRYDFVANCDQYTARRFWCDVSGRSGNCFRQGHASVKRTGGRYRYTHWVTLRGLDRECY